MTGGTAMNTKLNRRTVLRGSMGGAVITVGLPLLDCFLNGNGTALAATGKALPTCFGHWYQSLGLNPGMWIPEKIGANYENNVQLKLFDPFRERMNIFSGMKYFLDGRPHETHTSTVQIATMGAVIDSGEIGPSLDSKIADVIGKDTRFRSLEVSVEGSRKSWSRRSGTSVNPSEPSPVALYKRLFGPEFRDPNAAEFTPDPMLMARRSVLSVITDQRHDIMRQVGAADRARMEEYFTSIREIEHRLELGLQKPEPMPTCQVPAPPEELEPSTVIDNVVHNGKLFAQLLAYALACDQTRVFNVASSGSWREAGTTYTWHTATHEEAIDQGVGRQKKVFWYLTIANKVFAEFLRALDGVREGPGTLLDRTLVLWQTDHEDARTHSIENIPIMTVGGAGGLMTTGIHVSAPGDPCTRVGLTVQQAFGVPIRTWGDRSNETTRTITEVMGSQDASSV